jgi:hypothetical protein
MEYGIAALVLWIATLIGYVVWNLYNKNRKMEEMVVRQQIFIDGVKECMKEINVAANQIDSKIWVQSDPEFLLLMENVKTMQTKINEFIGE